ncbi:MAG: 30S ribosomal protein S8, partial [Bacteroidota bacterium]
MKYDKVTKKPAITSITRASKPGLRKYAKVKTMPR